MQPAPNPLQQMVLDTAWEIMYSLVETFGLRRASSHPEFLAAAKLVGQPIDEILSRFLQEGY